MIGTSQRRAILSSRRSRADDLRALLGNYQGLFADFTDDSSTIVDLSTPANNYRGKAFDKLTFTRASTRKRFNSAGLLEDVASGLPAIDYDPIARAIRGLQIEGARTNLLTYSEDFSNAVWVNTAVTVTSGAAEGPAGAATATSLIPDTSTSSHQLVQTDSITTGTTYTFSVYAKAAGYNWLRITLGSSAFSASGRSASFNVSTGALGAVQAGVTSAVTPAGNGWYRCSITATSVASASDWCTISINNADSTNAISFAGNGTSGILVYGAQLEAGAIASSYIPTTSATVTRAAEVCQLENTLFPATATGPYTILAKGICPQVWSGSDTRTIVSLNNVGYSNSRAIWRIAGGNVIPSNVAANVATTAFAGVATSFLSPIKVAVRFDLNNVNYAFNGSLPEADDTVSAYPTAPARISIGNIGTASVGHWHGWIQQVAVIPIALSNAQLQAVTA